MKYIEDNALSELSNCITDEDIGGKILICRLESFTCKRAGEDIRLSKKIDKEMCELSTSPGTSNPNFGSLSSQSVRRMLIDLIITMNAHFPDYDFSAASVDHFRKESSLRRVQNIVNSMLADLPRKYNVNLLDVLWEKVNQSIVLRQCQIYTYIPDAETGDPFSDGNLWSFNYFFYNPQLKKMLYFTCIAKLKFAASVAPENYEDDEYDENDCESSEMMTSDYRASDDDLSMEL